VHFKGRLGKRQLKVLGKVQKKLYRTTVKISNRLIQSKDKCRIWAPTLMSTLNLSSRARRSAKFSLRKRRSPPLVSNQCVVYKFQCNLCDADYFGYTTRHLPQRIGEHKYSAIGRHIKEHRLTKSALEDKHFSILKKCRSKFDYCLVFEILFI